MIASTSSASAPRVMRKSGAKIFGPQLTSHCPSPVASSQHEELGLNVVIDTRVFEGCASRYTAVLLALFASATRESVTACSDDALAEVAADAEVDAEAGAVADAAGEALEGVGVDAEGEA